MSFAFNQNHTSTPKRIDQVKRFHRSQDRDSMSQGKKALSECGSERADHIKNKKFLQDLLKSMTPEHQYDVVAISNKRKPKTSSQRFTVDRDNELDPQKESLKTEVKRLKMKNLDLQAQLKNLKESVKNVQNKENKPLNKMRQKTQKQRLKQLESENNHLKQTMCQLYEEIRQIKSSRLTQETNISSSDIIYDLEQKNDNNGNQVFILCQEIKKLQIQIDFLNRRNYGEIYSLKLVHDKQIKLLKDRISQVTKNNNELKKKNSQLIYTIKGTKQRKNCDCQMYKRQPRYSDLLELSCSD